MTFLAVGPFTTVLLHMFLYQAKIRGITMKPHLPLRKVTPGQRPSFLLCSISLLVFLIVSFAAEQPAAKISPQEEENVFVATTEWQAIPPGASVPPGLHVKLDLSTGERLGKLTDGPERQALRPAGQRKKESALQATDVAGFKSNKTGAKGILDSVVIKNTPEETLEASQGPPLSRRGTMLKVLSDLPPQERASMGIDSLLASRPRAGEALGEEVVEGEEREEERAFWKQVE